MNTEEQIHRVQHLSKLQNNILQLLSNGYSDFNIANTLRKTEKQISNNLMYLYRQLKIPRDKPSQYNPRVVAAILYLEAHKDRE